MCGWPRAIHRGRGAALAVPGLHDGCQSGHYSAQRYAPPDIHSPDLPSPGLLRRVSLTTSNELPDQSRVFPAKPNRLPGPLARASRPSARPPDAPPDVDWGRYRTAIRRFKWPVIAATLIGTLGGIVASRFINPVYAARASIWIEGANQKPPAPRGTAGSGDLLATTGWMDLSRSYVVLEPVVNQLRLYLSWLPGDSAVFASFSTQRHVRPGAYRLQVDSTGRSFTLVTKRGIVLQRGVVGDSVGAALGLLWVPPAAELTSRRRIDFAVESSNQAAFRLTERLRVKTDLDGNFLRLELRGGDPVRIAAIVNAVAERIVTVAGDLKRQQLTELALILGEQLKRAQGNLQAAEAALRSFLGKTVNFVTEGSAPVAPGLQFAHDPALNSYFETKVSLEQVRRDRAAIGQLLAQVPEAGLSVDALGAIGAVDRSTELAAALKDLTAKRAELRALQYRYTDAHLPVQRVAAQVQVLEHRTVPSLAQALLAEMAVKEAQLTERVNAASSDLRQIPPLAIEEARLQREVANAERLFTSVQQRHDEVLLAEATSIPDVRVLDPATEPERPVLETVPFVVLASLLGSLGLAVLGAVIGDRADPKVRYPDQVTEAMGLTILGAVPHVSRNGQGQSDRIAMVIEALRGVRLNLVHAHGAGPVMVTVSSPGRSDGKSFVASNLALAFAEVGYRTLLIDGDVRRGALHRALKVARKPGLTDVLAGRIPEAQVLQPTTYPALSFIGCGSRTTSGPELLSTAAMSGLVGGLRSQYDVILIDSPPLSAGVDAYVLGTLSGSLVLVLRTGVSDRELAEAKLDVLDRLPIRVLGAVLNDVRPGGAYRDYSYYLEGYEVQEEQDGGARKHILRATE